MKERFRVRTGYIVQLTNEQIVDLIEHDSSLVDIDGTMVEFCIDGTDEVFTNEADETFTIGFDGMERLTSGFPTRFYGLDELGGEDLVLLAEDRLDYEMRMIARADGTNDLDVEDIDIDEDELSVTDETSVEYDLSERDEDRVRVTS